MTDDPILMVDTEVTMALAEKLRSRCSASGECVVWTGARSKKGYGAVWIEKHGKHISAHRASWMVNRGPIPLGLQVLHRCDNPPCILADHLFLGTNNDNMKDKSEKGRHFYQKQTHCKRGHPFSGSNLAWREATPNHRAQRICRECQRESLRRSRREARA